LTTGRSFADLYSVRRSNRDQDDRVGPLRVGLAVERQREHVLVARHFLVFRRLLEDAAAASGSVFPPLALATNLDLATPSFGFASGP